MKSQKSNQSNQTNDNIMGQSSTLAIKQDESIMVSDQEKQDEDRFAKIRCSGANQAVDFCANENCTKNGCFICSVKNCSCRKLHSLCLKGDIEEAFGAICLKINKTQQVKIQIIKVIDNAIDELSKFRDELEIKIDTIVKYIDLSEVEKSFYFLNTKKDFKVEFTGESLSKMWYLASIKSDNKRGIFPEIMTTVRQLQSQFFEASKRNCSEIDEKIQNFKQNALNIERKNLKLSKQQKLQFINYPCDNYLFKRENIKYQKISSKLLIRQ